jgi:transposase InsO family protein
MRMRAVRLAKESGVAVAVEATGFSRASIYRWVRAFDERGITALLEESRRPQRMRVTVPSWVDTVIIAIRLHTYWNSKRIAAEMERRQIYRVSAKHIDQLFQRCGCSRGAVPPQAGPRYERSRPNELWHIDIKGPFFISLEGSGYLKTWIVGLVDDHSRFVLGLRIHTDAKLAPLLEWLDDCFEVWGQPIELMSDNGSPFVRFLPGLLPTGFGRRLAERRIRHLRTQISTPWTNGKIEAFWAVLQREILDRQRFVSLVEAEVALTRFAEYYNYHRLSGVLGWLTPAERYDGTPFTDRGFENIAALAHLQPWLQATMPAA